MRKLYAALASLGFLALIAWEIVHDIILNQPWAGFVPQVNTIVVLLVPLFAAGAIGVWLRNHFGVVCTLVGFAAALNHGLMTALGGSGAGSIIFFGSIVIGFLCWKAQTRTPYPGERIEQPPHTHQAA
jgi:hypothetical protein